MKRAILLLVGVALILVLIMPDGLVWSNKTYLSKPTVHKITKGEYLSKISLQYYGTAKYWRELALINRAPESDLVFPEEELFIPSRKVIEQLHKARSFSKVNNLYDDEEQLYATSLAPTDTIMLTQASDSGSSIAPAVAPVSQNDIAASDDESAQVVETEQAEGISPLFTVIGIIGLLGLLAIVGFIIYKKRKQADEQDLLNELNEVDLDALVENEQEDDEQEPDYDEYKKNRSERVYV